MGSRGLQRRGRARRRRALRHTGAPDLHARGLEQPERRSRDRARRADLRGPGRSGIAFRRRPLSHPGHLRRHVRRHHRRWRREAEPDASVAARRPLHQFCGTAGDPDGLRSDR